MRFQSSEDSVSPTETRYPHLLDRINRPADELDIYKIIIEISKYFNPKLSSPEVQLISRVIADRKYFTSPTIPQTLEEHFFAGSYYREEENPWDHNIYDLLLRDYKVNEIKQCLNMSFLEYLNLTPFEKIKCDKFSRQWSEKLAKMMQSAEKDTETRINDVREKNSSGTNHVTLGPDISQLEEYL